MTNDYFKFSRKERTGILILLFLLAIVLAAPYLTEVFYTPNINDYSAFDKQVVAFYNANNPETKPIEYFKFNPNTISKDSLLLLGLSNKQAQNVISYRKAGGVFNKPEDLKTLYTINDSVYLRISPFVYIPLKKSKKRGETKAKTQFASHSYDQNKEQSIAQKKDYSHKPIKLVQINTTDTLGLIALKGIGSTYANRIIKYRDLLGGFYSTNQLYEVYGLPDETILLIESAIVIDTLQINRLNINSTSFKEINKHPYINYNQTKSLIRYRDIMSKYNSVDEILSNHLMDSSTFYKIKPYLTIN